MPITCTTSISRLDKWFGYWHDGTKAADERMKERFRKKKERMNAKAVPN